MQIPTALNCWFELYLRSRVTLISCMGRAADEYRWEGCMRIDCGMGGLESESGCRGDDEVWYVGLDEAGQIASWRVGEHSLGSHTSTGG